MEAGGGETFKDIDSGLGDTCSEGRLGRGLTKLAVVVDDDGVRARSASSAVVVTIRKAGEGTSPDEVVTRAGMVTRPATSWMQTINTCNGDVHFEDMILEL